MEIKLSGHVISNVGVKKFSNEDNYLINGLMNTTSQPISEGAWKEERKGKGFRYAAVFDGMGGGACGQQASHIAAQELQKVLDKVHSGATEDTIDKLAKQGILNANRRIVEERKKHSILGTTATLLCILKNRAKLFHLGDSRAYLLQKNRLVQLSKDQTLAALKINAGIYTADNPAAQKDKNMLTEYVGADETLVSLRPLESGWISLNSSDKLLLCSDGLYHFCSDKEITEILQADALPEKTADRLICAALEHGGDDNITCLVVTVGDK